MCGIAGFFGGAFKATFVEEALCGLASRGPDGNGVWKNQTNTAALIHTRLAILDLSEGGSQPMVCERTGDSSDQAPTACILVFNGEIYNYRELRRDLEGAGEIFASDGDTEVLLRLLVLEGVGCLPKLAGMFSFAYWDEAAGSALLARDALGIKPLYYRSEEGLLAFASYTKLLRTDSDPVDATALRDFFLWGSVPDPKTLVVPVRQLPSGHCLHWKGGVTTIERWYRLPIGDEPKGVWLGPNRKGNRHSAAQVTRIALEESIRRHLVSDVPVGIFLSGGVDSTVLLALARSVLGKNADIRTFSIGFADPEFDESSAARRSAGHFGAIHTEWMMTQEEGVAEIPAFLQAIDQPGIDGFNTWCVSKLAHREGMKVVLSGLGGDEIFAGYSSFKRIPQFVWLHRHLGPMRPVVARLLESQLAGSPFRRLAQFLRSTGSWLEAYHVQRGIFTDTEAEQLTHLFSDSAIEPRECVEEIPNDALNAVSFLEVSRYMRFQLLRDSDVYSMAHSLELRVPFVDSRLIETLSTIPSDLRLRSEKQLLLDAVNEIPAWIRNQPKRGFRFPFQTWMEGEFGDLLKEATKQSPVALAAWYRRWALTVAKQAIK